MTGKVGGLSKVTRDLAEIKRERRARLRDRYLRGVGYVTRPVVYLGPVTLPVWWLWSYRGAFSQSLDSLTAIDLLLIGGCVVGFFGIAIPAMLFLLNLDGDHINWEDWGRIGLGLIVVAVVMVYWLTAP